MPGKKSGLGKGLDSLIPNKKNDISDSKVEKKQEKEKKLQQAMLGIKTKYGKNAVLKASSYTDGATMRQRNEQIGGHRAGGHDGKLQSK